MTLNPIMRLNNAKNQVEEAKVNLMKVLLDTRDAEAELNVSNK